MSYRYMKRIETSVRYDVIVCGGGLSVVEGKAFVDATGDADVCALAGCAFEMGDEDGEMAAASLEMHVENVDSDALIDYMKKTGDVLYHYRKGLHYLSREDWAAYVRFLDEKWSLL